MKQIKPGLAAIAVAAALAGCSTDAAMRSESLDRASEAYRDAQNTPYVPQRASAELDMAKTSLDQALALQAKGDTWHAVAHQAYLAEQRANVAFKMAEARAAQETVAKASQDRERFQADLRSRQEAERQRAEADAARAAQAQAAQAQAAQAQAALAQAALAQQADQSQQLNQEIQKLQSEIADMKVQQTNRGWVLTLGNEVLFDSGSATLKPGAQRAIDNLARFMQDHKDRSIAIEGFADAQGSEEYNQRLSERRAEAVKQALAGKGVDASRLETRGYGEAYPIASNDNPTGRQLNRRVEIVIPSEGTQVGARTQ